MKERLRIHDKDFRISITAVQIQSRINELASEINNDLKGKEVVFIAILNGAFMFASDLLKRITLNCKISFLKLASYDGSASTGKVKQLIGLNEDIRNKIVVVIEDIVDTGLTLKSIVQQIKSFEPVEIKIVTLLHKPETFEYYYKLDYVGFEIPNDFIIGYGLDYNGYGRNLESIYTIINQ